MDISQRRFIPQSIYNLIKLLKYDSNPVMLLGTAGLASQQYYSDFDLFTQIENKQSADQVYNKMMDIIKKMDMLNDTYFIEFKIQQKDGEKLKYNTIDEFDKSEFSKYFKNVDFIKLDYVIRIGNKFIELSIIYSFNKDIEKLSDDEKDNNFIQSVVDDVDKQRKEGNSFKALKRVFAIYNNKNMKDKLENTERYIFLSKFFNSDWGKLYAETANLKAIKLLLENYDDEETLKRAVLNLKDIKVSPDLQNLDKLIKRNEKKYNKEAEKIFTKLKSIKN